MKVLDLQCAHGHAFEGWFGSEDDFQSQRTRGLLECPVCCDRQIQKKLSAPRLNLGAAPQEPRQHDVATATDTALQAEWLKVVRRVMAQTEDVGQRFAEEARRIHYGEVPQRGIRGQASLEETHALADEGISVMPLLVPNAFNEPLH